MTQKTISEIYYKFYMKQIVGYQDLFVFGLYSTMVLRVQWMHADDCNVLYGVKLYILRNCFLFYELYLQHLKERRYNKSVDTITRQWLLKWNYIN